MNYLHEHKNFKHILKNRIPQPVYVIKNDLGLYQGFSNDSFVAKEDAKSLYLGVRDDITMRFAMFDKAKQLNAKVYLLTLAGEIEVKQEDFFNGF